MFRFWEAIEGTKQEFHALGTEMNQFYCSTAVYSKDEAPKPESTGHKVFDYEVSSYPGKRLPHVWLSTLIPSPKVSTQDLAGKGKFVLFTGPSGTAWKEAVKRIAEKTKIPLEAISIGFGCDYMDSYGDWRTRCQVTESGAVLVRPDRVVGWRSEGMIPNPEEKLLEVMNAILSRL